MLCYTPEYESIFVFSLLRRLEFGILTVRDCGRRHQEADARGPGAVTHQSDVGGIAAENSDVLLYPVQGRDLVH